MFTALAHCCVAPTPVVWGASDNIIRHDSRLIHKISYLLDLFLGLGLIFLGFKAGHFGWPADIQLVVIGGGCGYSFVMLAAISTQLKSKCCNAFFINAPPPRHLFPPNKDETTKKTSITVSDDKIATPEDLNNTTNSATALEDPNTKPDSTTDQEEPTT